MSSKDKRIQEIEKESGEPNFWNNKDQAQILLKEKSSLEKAIQPFKHTYQEYEDAAMLAELAHEEGDEVTLLEVQSKLAQLHKKIEELEFYRMLSGERDTCSAIMSINSGAGGTEADDWASMILRMYLRWGDAMGFKTDVIHITPGDEAGIKSATVEVLGEYAYGYLKAEVGIHRLVRISPYDANKRRHTSFAAVFVYPEIEDDVAVEIDVQDLRIDTYRAGGAGGQHVNKTDSAVRLTHLPSGIVVQCQSERSQHKNKEKAMKVLRSRLYEKMLEEKQAEKVELEKKKKKIEWGSQIRSYVMQPYRLVKDHRTDFEVGDVDRVMDGDVTPFMKAYLLSGEE